MTRSLSMFLGVGLIFGLGSLSSGCSSSQYREQDRIGRWMIALEKHLQSPNVEAAVAPLAAEFRFFPDGPDAPGLDRDQTAALLRWEYALHRKLTSAEFRFDAETITATCHSENDLSRLVDAPGWEVTTTWTFDGRSKITRAISVTGRNSPNFRNWLAPAIAWMREHRPADLTWLYPDGELQRTPRAAARWVEVLTEWRAATGRRPIDLESRSMSRR